MTPNQKTIALLCAAFDKSIAVNSAIKNDKWRSVRLYHLFEWALTITHRQGKVFVNDNEDAVALILDSTKISTMWWEDLKLIYRSIASLVKIINLLQKQTTLKNHYPKKPHYRLWFLGVLPEKQGQGVGSTLLKEVIEYYKNETIYLETATSSNISFYENNGFRLVKKIETVKPTTWIFTN